MKNAILCGIVIFLSIVLIGVVSFRKEASFSFPENKDKEEEKEPVIEEMKIKLLTQTTGEIKELNIEDYIIGVVAAEMPATFKEEALKAQAIASRTFAVYKKELRKPEYDLIAGISDQAYNTKEDMQKKWKDKFDENYNKISKAVNETKSEIIKYQGKAIEAFYFSMSNGKTENCDLVFRESLPYLVSVDSSWENNDLNNYEVTKTFTKEEFCKILNISCEQIEISNIERTNANRVRKLNMNGKEFTGVEIRKLLTLRSTDFDIAVSEDVKITTRGNGHGVGMSQYGANGMASTGSTSHEIIKHYYQNIEILKI